MSMTLSKGILTYFEAVVPLSISPESDAGITIRDSHYGPVVRALPHFLLHLQQSLGQCHGTPGRTGGSVQEPKGHRT